jgi:hypothetical protein
MQGGAIAVLLSGAAIALFSVTNQRSARIPLVGQPWEVHTATSAPAGAVELRAPFAAVPEGRRLALDFVSVRWTVPDRQSGVCSLYRNGYPIFLPAPSPGISADGAPTQTISQPLRGYADPGELGVVCSRADAAGPARLEASLIGHMYERR